MARTERNLSAISEPMTSEETALLDADRDSEHSSPESQPEPEASPEPEAPVETAAPEAEAPEQPEIDPTTGKQRKVDYGALHAEREKRRAAEAREREKGEQLAKLMGRFDVLSQLAQQGQKAAPQAQPEAPIEVPDINTDPVGHFEARTRLAEKQLADMNKWRESQEANATAMNNVKRLQEHAQAHEAEFRKATPDYDDAFQYLRHNRDAELQAMGYSDPAVRQQIINNDALQIAAQSLQGNRNAAEAVYNIAKARGWASKPPAPVAPVIHPDTQKLQTVAKGQKTSTSLGQVNGSAPADTGVEAILKMSDAEFAAKFAGADGEANWRKLMGG